MKIRPVGAALFRANKQTDGQTDMTRLMVAFGNFATAPKMVLDMAAGVQSPSPLPRIYVGTSKAQMTLYN